MSASVNHAGSVQFPAGELLHDLQERSRDCPISDTARRDLTRYYRMVRNELRWLSLSEGEAGAVCDLLRDAVADEVSISGLCQEVTEALWRGTLAGKWDINACILGRKLRTLSPGGLWALIDAVERFWGNQGNARLTLGEQFQAVGLVTPRTPPAPAPAELPFAR